MKLVISKNTVFKPSDAQSANLPPEEIAAVEEGSEFEMLAYREVGRHLIVTLNPATEDLSALHPSGKNTWYVYKGHIVDPEGYSAGNDPRDKPAEASREGRGFEFEISGVPGLLYSNDPIPGVQHFKWREALHFDQNGKFRRPHNSSVGRNIIRIAKVLENARLRLGGEPVTITSWYRDPVTNRAVGGASQSRHMRGDAVDFRVPHKTPRQVYSTLDTWWQSQGGLAAGVGFTHLDGRGYRARWSYPGA